MIVFHAGTVKIEEFYIPYGGLHVGGYQSAIRCALRKLYEERSNNNKIEHIHLHTCQLVDLIYYDGEDAGNNIGWQKMFNTALLENPNYNSIKYINKYEPDIMPSYSIFSTKNIKILDHSTIHMDVVEDILNEND